MTTERNREIRERLIPDRVRVIIPVNLTLDNTPRDLQRWSCEYKYNGVRGVIFISEGDVKIFTVTK